MSVTYIGPTRRRDGYKVVAEVYKCIDQVPVVDIVAICTIESLNKSNESDIYIYMGIV